MILLDKILCVAIQNVDVFAVNLAVFFFGYSIFSLLNKRKEDAKAITTPKLTACAAFYYEGENAFNGSVSIDNIDESKTIYTDMFLGEPPVQVEPEEFINYTEYEKYNEAYEVTIANNNQLVFLSRIGAVLVAISTIITLVSNSSFIEGVLVSILYFFVGTISLWVSIKIAQHLYPPKECPMEPIFKNRKNDN